MRYITFIVIIIICIFLFTTQIGSYNTNRLYIYHKKVKITGYYPSGYKTYKEAKLEGGNKDCFGHKLHTISDFRSGKSIYVSVAVDPKYIPLHSYILINKKGLDDCLFYACDVGGKINKNHIDICVDNKKQAYSITGYADIIVISRRR